MEADQLSGFYGNVLISHRLNEYISHSLSAGRSVQLSFYSGAVDLYYVRWNASWKLLEKIGLNTMVSYEGGEQFSYGREEFDRYGAGITLSRGLTKKLNASLGYQFYDRLSDLPGRDYTLNIISLNFNYTF